MSLPDPISRPASVQPLPSLDDRIPLVAALGELLGSLDPFRERGTGSRSKVKRWEGDGAVYLELALPGIGGTEVDINVHEGRAFIRMEAPGIRPRASHTPNPQNARRKGR